jgi:Family of unknown function (DUF5313)
VDAYERRCRRLIRLAYPPRFRDQRADELLGVLLDVAEPGADRPSVGLALDVLAGGVRHRLRTRPPLYRWLLYRAFDDRLPDRFRAWVRDDVRGRFWSVRRALGLLVPLNLFFCAVLLYSVLAHGRPVWVGPDLTAELLLVVVLERGAAWMGGRSRRKILLRHGLGEDGAPIEVGGPTGHGREDDLNIVPRIQ